MARTFGGVSTDKVAVGNYAAINDLSAFTIAVWTYRTGTGGGGLGRMMDKVNANANGAFLLYHYGTAQYGFEAGRWQTTNGQWRTNALPSANAWHHICVTYDYGATTNDPIIYVDGTSVAITEVATPAGTLASETETFNIGNNDANNRNWAGRLCETAVFNRILGADEANALGKGYSPLFYRRGLVGYWPLNGRQSPEPNRVAGNTGTVTGTVRVDHPRIMYPTDPKSYFVAAAAGGAGDQISFVRRKHTRIRARRAA